MGYVLLAFYFLLREEIGCFIWTSAFVILVFRSELALFLGLFLLIELITRKVSLEYVFAHSVCALLIWVVLSSVIDSYFWKKPIWPEGMVFYFNVVCSVAFKAKVSGFFLKKCWKIACSCHC